MELNDDDGDQFVQRDPAAILASSGSSCLNVLVVALDNIFNGIGALTAATFDVLPGSRQEIDALVNSGEIFVVDVPVLECQRLGQGTIENTFGFDQTGKG